MKLKISTAMLCAFSLEASSSENWICRSIDVAFGKSFRVDYAAYQGTAFVFERDEGKLIDFAKLPICIIGAIPPGNDRSTPASCHDGLWRDSVKVDFELGGFVPWLGSATLSVGGPETYLAVDDLTCHLVERF